jgi:hypothetical protein
MKSRTQRERKVSHGSSSWTGVSTLALVAAFFSIAAVSGCTSCGAAPEDPDAYVGMSDGEAMQEEMADEVITDSER